MGESCHKGTAVVPGDSENEWASSRRGGVLLALPEGVIPWLGGVGWDWGIEVIISLVNSDSGLG